MVGIIDQKLCGACIQVVHDASSLPPDLRDRYIDSLCRAADGDHAALAEARSILDRCDRDLSDLQDCQAALDRLNSKDTPRVKSRIAKLTKQLEATDIELGKLRARRDELEHSIAKIEADNGAILNSKPLRQRIGIISQNQAVRFALHQELAAVGL